MKQHLLCSLGLVCALGATAADNDPVLMKVAGKDVKLSEFEYLYNKNNNQQLEPLSIDRYLDMFIDYKLKVADAEAAGLDTTATFRKEYQQYRDELAKPYLRDNALADKLVREAYSHYGDDVTVSHIMLPPSEAGHATADSIANAIAAGTITFEEAARRYSVDRYSNTRGGLMGTVNPGRFPWEFEKAAYDTPVGAISAPINSGMGWHLVRVESRRPAEGEVHASHILLTTRGAAPEVAAAAKVTIDSLYAIAKTDPTTFAELAKKHSQDPGSGKRGGDLGWFGRGMMVQPFDSISFALADGAVSEPFLTDFGWHIIYKHGKRTAGTLDEVRPAIEKAMQRDSRGSAPERAFAEKCIAEQKGSLNETTMKAVAEALAHSTGKLDSIICSPALRALPAYTIGGKRYPLSSLAANLAGAETTPEIASSSAQAVRMAAEAAMTETALDAVRQQLLATNPDYRNLANEYRDGILLFEIANNKVWDRASTDRAGLEAFFNASRDKYTWDTPHFKSYVIFADSPETLQGALDYAATLDPADPAAFTAAMKKKFERKVKVERVVAAKGDNPITDYLGFGEEKPAAKTCGWENYDAFAGR
ncbi:MAG: peptidylprolyl isomerase, partial [Muribaculaceae bacterium]|nr:peptidylprolyl isomerase [Muribaculaceae bacterium]